MIKEQYGKITAGLIGAWFVFSLVASALHLFQSDFSRAPIALGLGALIPIVVLALWFALSAGFREFVLALNPRTLTYVESWRVAGFVFLVLYTYRILPGIFALPAGWGDIAIGATAPLVAWKLADPAHRTGFIVWQVLGMLDLVTAVTLGTTARLIAPHGVSTTPLTVLPLSLIPTFAVPLMLILHFICIAQAKGWRTRADSRFSERLPYAVV